ncbi:MAG: helix-turn-helix transcriptional regulator [Burkholderiales bacterium]|nr:helix-turn-helix transcriptional regulator [Burkholderiales bacterium]
MVFPEHHLERPAPTADPLLYRMMEDRAHEMLSGGNEDVTGHVRLLLRQWVATSDCSVERTAKAMGMHPRTLNRALAAEGTTFERLRETIRFQEACRLLRNTRMRAGEVAATLGCADASSFTRALRPWAGASPDRWRTAGGGAGEAV